MGYTIPLVDLAMSENLRLLFASFSACEIVVCVRKMTLNRLHLDDPRDRVSFLPA